MDISGLIHIGMPKAASTFLQKQYFANIRCINYLGRYGVHGSSFEEDLNKILFKKVRLDNYDKDFCRSFLDKEKFNVFSAERLTYGRGGEVWYERAARLRELFGPVMKRRHRRACRWRSNGTGHGRLHRAGRRLGARRVLLAEAPKNVGDVRQLLLEVALVLLEPAHQIVTARKPTPAEAEPSARPVSTLASMSHVSPPFALLVAIEEGRDPVPREAKRLGPAVE